VFTRTFLGASSIARERVRESIAPLEAEYKDIQDVPSIEETDDMKTIEEFGDIILLEQANLEISSEAYIEGDRTLFISSDVINLVGLTKATPAE
tara:strand:+ start:1472 stop:1753 length:282 start_codon:yes stop_codon:yes gene_type:complete